MGCGFERSQILHLCAIESLYVQQEKIINESVEGVNEIDKPVSSSRTERKGSRKKTSQEMWASKMDDTKFDNRSSS